MKRKQEISKEEYMEIRNDAKVCIESYLTKSYLKPIADFISLYNKQLDNPYDVNSIEYSLFYAMVCFPDNDRFLKEKMKAKKNANLMAKMNNIPITVVMTKDFSIKLFEAYENGLDKIHDETDDNDCIAYKNQELIKLQKNIDKSIEMCNSSKVSDRPKRLDFKFKI